MRYKYHVAIIKIAKVLGRYKSFAKSEEQCVEVDPAFFQGDAPTKLFGRLQEGYSPTDPKEILQLAQLLRTSRERHRLEYVLPRRATERVHNLIYTPLGMGWLDGSLYKKFSLLDPYKYGPTTFSKTIGVFLKPKSRNLDYLSQGTLVESDVISTYGDWIFDYLFRLIKSMPVVQPIVLPQYIADKPYVRRDLDALGIKLRAIRNPTLIRDAFVIRKTEPGVYCTREDVEAYRRAFGIKSTSPRSGSIVYLSRSGLSSEAGKKAGSRAYPSETVASIVEELGGKVIITNQTSYEEYCQIVSETETVIADHGAAMCNILLWNPRNVIELFSNDWWMDCFLFLGKATGVVNYALINIDDFEHSLFRQKLISMLESFEGK